MWLQSRRVALWNEHILASQRCPYCDSLIALFLLLLLLLLLLMLLLHVVTVDKAEWSVALIAVAFSELDATGGGILSHQLASASAVDCWEC